MVLATAAAVGATPPAGGFRFTEPTAESLALWQGSRPVLVYNHGLVHKPGVPADLARSTYFHPIYGLDGEVLTDDFPADHFHHRGLFWAWPHVTVDGQESDLWMLRGVQQKFERWLAREARDPLAVLGVENGWYMGARKILQERVWVTVHAATADGRVIDLEFTWTPTDRPVSLRGAEDKSYGGLTLRFAPQTNAVITTPRGQGPDDLLVTRLPWADLSARFKETGRSAGAAIFVAPDHPDYAPTWMTRHYGVLCLGWPGLQARTLSAGDAVRCRYRLYIHQGFAQPAALAQAYKAYALDLGVSRGFSSGRPDRLPAR